MLLWLVKFPKHHWPREIAYCSYKQAVRMCEKFNIPQTKANFRIVYFEEDKDIVSFSKEDL